VPRLATAKGQAVISRDGKPRSRYSGRIRERGGGGSGEIVGSRSDRCRIVEDRFQNAGKAKRRAKEGGRDRIMGCSRAAVYAAFRGCFNELQTTKKGGEETLRSVLSRRER